MDQEEFEQKALQAIQHLEKVWTESKNCPICGHNHWTVGDIAELRNYGGLNSWAVVESKRITPVVLLNCTNCGYMHMFNALAAGILEKPGPGGDVKDTLGGPVDG